MVFQTVSHFSHKKQRITSKKLPIRLPSIFAMVPVDGGLYKTVEKERVVIRKGLIIDEPWISKILAGQKTWEMRSRASTVREQIALIRKGSGLVVGRARIIGCRGPLDREEMVNSIALHCIPRSSIESGQVDRWCYAWELADVKPITSPVPYAHPKGAVIWVRLEESVQKAILGDDNHDAFSRKLDAAEFTAMRAASRSGNSMIGGAGSKSLESNLVPFAKDGTYFGNHLKRGGRYQIGAKGEEAKYDSYLEALDKLRKMPTARWRRPNANGNWGIVSAVRWGKPSE